MKSRVFLVCEPTRRPHQPDTRNLHALEKFGEVVLVIGRPELEQLRFSPNTRWADKLMRRLLDAGYHPERDYVVWAGGDTLAAVLFGAALMHGGAEGFRWLRHDRSKLPGGGWGEGRYFPMEVQLAFDDSDPPFIEL